MVASLNLEQLESRSLLSAIPGWDGPVQTAVGNFDGSAIADTATVALTGGSAHVRVVAGDGTVLLDTIAFDPFFRGGGSLAVVGRSLLVVPGPGGGPVVDQFDFTAGGTMQLSSTFFAPYPISFRGGLHISSAIVNGHEDALFLPGEGGAPQLLAVDLRTHETDLSIYVGDPSDFSGSAQFEPTGGTVEWAGQIAFVVQYGPTVADYAATRLWSETGSLMS